MIKLVSGLNRLKLYLSATNLHVNKPWINHGNTWIKLSKQIKREISSLADRDMHSAYIHKSIDEHRQRRYILFPWHCDTDGRTPIVITHICWQNIDYCETLIQPDPSLCTFFLRSTQIYQLLMNITNERRTGYFK